MRKVEGVEKFSVLNEVTSFFKGYRSCETCDLGSEQLHIQSTFPYNLGLIGPLETSSLINQEDFRNVSLQLTQR